MNSDEFKNLTNQRLRNNFCRNFFGKPENEKYIDAFRDGPMGYKYNFSDFIDVLYKKYKKTI
ncbi:hypothetical protein [Clostridium arbusti]|uniref:hypothetical protein n=1 Tax=Clostridium arbusti TaxID=1137848 RepID=UPI000288A7D7|nr:hypothetical protein [Clostridium arbusti]